ncbi:hypothetical protein M427DRAFT_54292 [Gonapodya prolifera JEL478]|uniref:Uncharacterized protein n=1 Tax=Gonapodya prolifera (strain JEL478) TaxID=1344416 RepID=A0A139AMA4_GONPJ|nr:hypothetical protein M427DRAFT_54292 [Gonapodya prolifera JEL478]|eukprot:KXS17694.1 hypothetical protein M427DRAFT_54292 [Gonapodya prolifera JEL478]
MDSRSFTAISRIAIHGCVISHFDWSETTEHVPEDIKGSIKGTAQLERLENAGRETGGALAVPVRTVPSHPSQEHPSDLRPPPNVPDSSAETGCKDGKNGGEAESSIGRTATTLISGGRRRMKLVARIFDRRNSTGSMSHDAMSEDIQTAADEQSASDARDRYGEPVVESEAKEGSASQPRLAKDKTVKRPCLPL